MLAKTCASEYDMGMTTQPKTTKKRAPKQVLTVRVTPEIKERLDHLVSETNRPLSYYITDALETGLDAIEPAYLLKNDAEMVRAGKLKTRSLAEVKAEMGL